MQKRLVGWVALGLACATALAGCSRSSTKQSELLSQESAQQAMEEVLNAWKKGPAGSGKLSLGGAGIEVRDAARNSRQNLKTYEIHPEEPQGAARWFTVKLTLAKGEETVKYAVLGKDPIWVYSEQDFRSLSSWGDDPLHPPAAPAPNRRGGR
ncbi:MAG: hypothetical protein ACLQNE_46190 [Thermoguttaceae bacterium]